MHELFQDKIVVLFSIRTKRNFLVQWRRQDLARGGATLQAGGTNVMTSPMKLFTTALLLIYRAVFLKEGRISLYYDMGLYFYRDWFLPIFLQQVVILKGLIKCL